MTIKNANDMPPPPFRPPAGATPNELAAQVPGGEVWRESLEQARAALEREHQQQQERERILAADRELVTRLFLSHVQRQQQAQLSAPAVGAGVGALACATWCGSKWNGEQLGDLVEKVAAGAMLGTVAGVLAGALYERVSGGLPPRVSAVLPPEVDGTLVLFAFKVSPTYPEWRREAWQATWAELAQRYIDSHVGLGASLPLSVGTSGIRVVMR